MLQRAALCLIAVAATLAPPARAEVVPLPLPTGCALTSVPDDALDPATWRGVLYSKPVAAAALPLPAGDVLANPVSITLTCTLHVHSDTNPDPAIETSGSGIGVAAVRPEAVTYRAGVFDSVGVCGKATLVDAHGATYTYYQRDDNSMWYSYPESCDGFVCLSLGENCYYPAALLGWVLDRYDPLLQAGDRTACPLIGGAAPGVGGVVDVDPSGDTYVDGEFLWDCEPYSR
jgi:hypothetical protein